MVSTPSRGTPLLCSSLTEPNTFVCIEGFRDSAAGGEHMAQEHVARFMREMPDIVSARPQIIYVDAEEVTGFGPMGRDHPPPVLTRTEIDR